jgi:hypothetical protein
MNKNLTKRKEKTMKTKFALYIFLFAISLAISCRGVSLVDINEDTIKPSDVIITQERDVSDFTGIDMRTFGKVILSQGDNESLTIKGSDNIVPVIQTSVRDGILDIQTEENINITSLGDNNLLIFTIVVKDISSLTISGAADVELDSLSTSKLEITMSGAGQVELGYLNADSLNIMLSGVGNVEVSGEVTKAWIDIPGAGSVNASDLKIQTVDVSISGIGGATLWVTDRLTGTISGGGTVSYYGNPQTNTETTGLGSFKSLGSK